MEVVKSPRLPESIELETLLPSMPQPHLRNIKNPVPISHLIWPCMNETDETILLHRSDGSIKKIFPGERIVLPKQEELLASMFTHDATLYGGARGGGKSVILRWAAIYFLMRCGMSKEEGGYGERGVTVGIFCEDYPALEDRQIKYFRDEMPLWLGTYNAQRKEYRLAERYGGGRIIFRNLENASKFRSVEIAAAFFEESTMYSKQTYEKVTGSVRHARLPICPIVLATNPGSIGHGWNFDLFVNPNTRLGPQYDARTNRMTRGNNFIQALPTDNPFLTDDYWERLNRLDAKLKAAWLDGDWSVYEGQFFQLVPEIHQCAPVVNPPDGWTLFRAIDPGWSHPFVCLWGAVSPDGKRGILYREHSYEMKESAWHKQEIMRRSVRRLADGQEIPELYYTTVMDKTGFDKDHSGYDTNVSLENILNAPDDGIGSLEVVMADNDQINNLRNLRQVFSYETIQEKDEHGVVIASHVTRPPQLHICSDLIHTWSSLTRVIHDENNREKIKKTTGEYKAGEGDDETDTAGYIVKEMFGPVFNFNDKYSDYQQQNTAPTYLHQPYREKIGELTAENIYSQV